MWSPSLSRISDLECGDRILGRMLVETHSSANEIFADISDPMLELKHNVNGLVTWDFRMYIVISRSLRWLCLVEEK
jgi:hypothetical protein